jgi:hypothetical protein
MNLLNATCFLGSTFRLDSLNLSNFGFVSSSSSQLGVDGNDGLRGSIQGFFTSNLGASSYVNTLGVFSSTSTQVNSRLGSSSLLGKKPSSCHSSAYISTTHIFALENQQIRRRNKLILKEHSKMNGLPNFLGLNLW